MEIINSLENIYFTNENNFYDFVYSNYTLPPLRNIGIANKAFEAKRTVLWTIARIFVIIPLLSSCCTSLCYEKTQSSAVSICEGTFTRWKERNAKIG